MKMEFTDKAQDVLQQAVQEAIKLGHDYIGTEHLLLALVRHRDSGAITMLRQARIAPRDVSAKVIESIRRGKATIARGQLPYTSRSKKALKYAMSAAREVGSVVQATGTGKVDTEHLLIGLVREEMGIAAQVLHTLGLTSRLAETLMSGAAGDTQDQPRFQFRIDDSSDLSIYEQLIAQAQEGVATGKLQPGDRLPAVRQLADDLNIAPGTVARAYSELESRGVIVTEGARGTRIAERKQMGMKDDERPETLAGLLRPVAVAAFHLGATSEELRVALETAMHGIYE